MKIYTFKLTRKYAVAAVLALALLIALLILILPSRKPDAAGAAAIRSQSDCAEFLASLGYETEPVSPSPKRVCIPETFDAVYDTYNSLQKDCGYDLLPYAGKKAELSTFRVTNFPSDEQVLLDVLVYRRKIIGGSVYTAAIDGFMYGLQPLAEIHP